MSEKDNLQEADGIKALKPEENENDKIAVAEPSEESDEIAESTVEQNPKEGDGVDEIESSNAKASEKEETPLTDHVQEKDYKTMSMEDLVTELESLLKSDKIHLLKNHIEGIKQSFNKQFGALLEAQKKEFLDSGGNSIDFRFDFPLKSKFNALFKDYRERRQTYYQNLEKSLKANLENRLEIIEEIKKLINVEENINTTYKHFKALQERWRNGGPIPRDKYNNVWNNYHHHVENFYDFLHLNRDLRDLDFKYNLERKQKIIERAEELAQDEDSNRAFRELQALHKMWKEELGPVAKEYRDEIWERFRAATRVIHERRQAFYKELEKAYLDNLEKKEGIISEIEKITSDDDNNHNAWQKKIKQVEELRQQFFSAGKVPIKVNEATWAKFKETVRAFNRKKNTFYKSLKKEQYENLRKKMDLIKIAEENKDSEDFETTTPLMKKIQSDWKSIGHVPRRDSDKIWNQFKSACNHYFDRLHKQLNADNKEESEAFDKKMAMLDELKTISFGKDLDKNLSLIKEQIETWKSLGSVPFKKRYIEGKFNKVVNALYNKLDASKSEIELLKFDNKIESFANEEDKRLLDNEHNFVRKKIDEIKGEINQLENNMQFFSNVEDDNPVVKEVQDKLNLQKEELGTWQEKLKRIKKFY